MYISGSVVMSEYHNRQVHKKRNQNGFHKICTAGVIMDHLILYIMPRPQSTPLRVYLERFDKYKRPRQIMFCKRYKVEKIWDIGVGAVIDLDSVNPRLIAICQGLYIEDSDWFVGDVDALMRYEVE